MANINTEHLAFNLVEDAQKVFEAICDKAPDITEFAKDPQRLAALQGDNADLIGAMLKDSLGTAEYVCRNGRAIRECAAEIARVDRRVGIALLAGGAALCLGGYIYYKMNAQQTRIDRLEHEIAMLKVK